VSIVTTFNDIFHVGSISKRPILIKVSVEAVGAEGAASGLREVFARLQFQVVFVLFDHAVFHFSRAVYCFKK
jgi:hypothetical protein